MRAARCLPEEKTAWRRRCRRKSRPIAEPEGASDYNFHAGQGPEVKVLVEGVKISTGRLHLLVPIFEEGTVDADLLNEGQILREYLSSRGTSARRWR